MLYALKFGSEKMSNLQWFYDTKKNWRSKAVCTEFAHFSNFLANIDVFYGCNKKPTRLHMHRI